METTRTEITETVPPITCSSEALMAAEAMTEYTESAICLIAEGRRNRRGATKAEYFAHAAREAAHAARIAEALARYERRSR